MIIRFLTLFLGLMLFCLHADTPVKQLLSPEATLKLLEPLKPYAIVIGSGPKEVHSFIDPYCSLSQEYLGFLYARHGAMLQKYTIYLYLYELPRKHSAKIIETLLDSDMQETMLRAVMLQHETMIETGDGNSSEAVEMIAQAAEKIGVNKRPYIIINGKVK